MTKELRVVWALFDSETATVAKALPECEVYSFGKGSGKEHIDLDLSDFATAKKVLDTYPKPDVIFASPPCESWVSLSIGNLNKYTKEKGLNLHWKKKWEGFDFLPRFKETRLNGINTALTLAKIIQHYKPKFWAVENGNSSLIFSYMYEFANLIGYKNKCNYGSYKFPVHKPTIILSNKILALGNFSRTFLQRTQVIARRKTIEKMSGGYNAKGIKQLNYPHERSLVPPGLYRDIMRQFRFGGQPTMFDLTKEAV